MELERKQHRPRIQAAQVSAKEGPPKQFQSREQQPLVWGFRRQWGVVSGAESGPEDCQEMCRVVSSPQYGRGSQVPEIDRRKFRPKSRREPRDEKYYRQQILQSGSMSSKPMRREFQSLAILLDCLVEGNVLRAMDICMQRMKSLELMSQAGHPETAMKIGARARHCMPPVSRGGTICRPGAEDRRPA